MEIDFQSYMDALESKNGSVIFIFANFTESVNETLTEELFVFLSLCSRERVDFFAEMYKKIMLDIPRTFKTDKKAMQTDFQDSLTRILNAFVIQHRSRFFCASHSTSSWLTPNSLHKGKNTGSDLIYVQGMNAISAPFLFVMSEIEAFSCCSKLFETMIPRYINTKTQGSKDAVAVHNLLLSPPPPF